MRNPVFPTLYQVNTRVWLTGLSRGLGRPATLDDIPDSELDRIAAMGFDWVWLLSVWQTGPISRQVSRTIQELRREFGEVLPDLQVDDIAGSGFAIAGYSVHDGLGGEPALARLRQRLHRFGLKLMLDFVPNHTGLDHPWIQQHPDWFVKLSPDLVPESATILGLSEQPVEGARTLLGRLLGGLDVSRGLTPLQSGTAGFGGQPNRLTRDLNQLLENVASPVGRAFSIRNCDAFFLQASRSSLDETAQKVAHAKDQAKQQGRELGVYTVGVVTCKPTKKAAEEYYHHCMEEHADWSAVDGILALKNITPETVPMDQFVIQRSQFALLRQSF